MPGFSVHPVSLDDTNAPSHTKALSCQKGFLHFLLQRGFLRVGFGIVCQKSKNPLFRLPFLIHLINRKQILELQNSGILLQ